MHFRRIESDFGKSRGKTKQRTQLQVHINLSRTCEGLAFRILHHQTFDAQAQHVRIERHFLDDQLRIVALANRVDGEFLDEPGHEEEPDNGIQGNNYGGHPEFDAMLRRNPIQSVGNREASAIPHILPVPVLIVR